MTTSERAQLLGPWVGSWASRFGAGDDNLRAWLAAGRPRADRGALSVVGDSSIVEAVRAVVDKLPEAVAHFVVGNVILLCSGIDTRGFCDDLPTPPCASPLVVALTAADEALGAHELAHSWGRRRVPAAQLRGAAPIERVRNALCALVVEDGIVDALVDHRMQRELAANELARQWGFDIAPRTACLRESIVRGIHRRAAKHAATDTATN